MKITPKTEEQLQAEAKARREANLWPVGEYNFEVAYAEDSESKKGNPMIVLTLNVFNEENKSQVVKDYLLESMDYKVRHACVAMDILEKYESGEFEAFDFMNGSGKVKLGVQKGGKKDTGGFYDDRNCVLDYIDPRAGLEVLDDELPF